jgi:small subunit ribosomal protein S16
MAVKIRLSRKGKKNAPFSRIVAVDSRKKRDGAFLEDLGTYDMLESKVVRILPERIEDWVSKGAIVTDAVKRICKTHQKATAPAAVTPPVARTPKAPKKAAAQPEQENVQA